MNGEFIKIKIPYLIKEKGNPSIIIFEPSRELLMNVTNRVDDVIKTYDMILPPDCSICIIGYNPNLPKDHSQEEIAHATAEFIQEKYRSGIVFGISYGGFISIPFAALYPELVQKMVLLVSAYAPSERGAHLMREFMQLIKDKNQYAAVKKFNSLILNPFLRALSKIITWTKRKSWETGVNPPSTFINAYNIILKTDGATKKHLPKIKAPTLVVGGDLDQFFSKEVFKETVDLIPKGKLELYHNQGHYLPIEKMKSVKAVLAKFIRSND